MTEAKDVISVAKEILYSIAETSTGQLVKAGDAEKGESYVCPGCSGSFILRKGSQKRPHFAHKNLSPNCTPETVLHYSFKTLLCQKIQDCIDRKSLLEIHWNCDLCGGRHTGNLLKKAVQVKSEHNLGSCQPDVALLDQNGCPIAVIEVIVTRAPEQAALNHYKLNQIAVVTYVLESDEDIHRLDSPVLEPDSVDLCTTPKCSKCGEHTTKKRLLIIEANCWKCRAPMKVAALRADKGYLSIGGFIDLDIQLATQHGAFLQSHYSQTAGERYVANTCRRCKAFIGNHYLFGDYVADLALDRQELDAGYYCPGCDLDRMDADR